MPNHPSLTALILLERREHDRDAALDEIRREIQLGIDQAEAGQLRDGEEVFAEIREQIEVGARQADAGLLRDGREVFENIRRCRVEYP